MYRRQIGFRGQVFMYYMYPSVTSAQRSIFTLFKIRMYFFFIGGHLTVYMALSV